MNYDISNLATKQQDDMDFAQENPRIKELNALIVQASITRAFWNGQARKQEWQSWGEWICQQRAYFYHELIEDYYTELDRLELIPF